MPEYYNNILCVSKPELTDGEEPIISSEAYKHYVKRFAHVRVRRGSPAGPALLNWELLRADMKRRYIQLNGDPRNLVKSESPLKRHITPDGAAFTYFATYQKPDGKPLEEERQIEYTTNACVLNAIGRRYAEAAQNHKRAGNAPKKLWPVMAQELLQVETDPRKGGFAHTLPTNYKRLQEKYAQYMQGGKPNYDVLIHRGIGNKSAQIIDEQVERLILSLYCAENLPFGDWVYDYYLQFLAGSRPLVDMETGVLFDRDDYYDEKRSTYRTISRASVWNIIHKPENIILVDRIRNNRIDHITKLTPFNQRRSPEYSLSKISMDDRTLPRKMSDGRWLNSYLAFDVTSGAILGAVYSPEKPTTELIWECFRDMYRTIEDNGLMWPLECEVENHLMKDIEPELRSMFPFVTFCTPGLSRSKRAEHGIRAKKYGTERQDQVGVGRWNGKGVYKIKSEGKDEEYKQPRLAPEILIAEDKAANYKHNHSPHPDQKRFKGKTRWQVLLENMNPDASRPLKFKLFKYIGLRTETSIRNNDYCQVQYANYGIDVLENIYKLKPNNYNVQAYYLPDTSGNIGEVFIYQGDTFIGKASKIERYNEAKAERTERDEQIRTDQAKRQAHFFKVEREGIQRKIARKVKVLDEIPVMAEVEILPSSRPTYSPDDIGDLDELTEYYNGDWVRERALENI